MPKEVTHSEDNGATVTVGWMAESVSVSVDLGKPFRFTDPAHNDADCTGLFAWLDRAGLNKLIRDLRRARDRAYGADA